jgi:phytoene dehydrogenase-like protein
VSEAVVIGGGPDALVAAHLLARRGHRVTLLREQAAPSRTTGWVPAQLQRDLALADLALERPDPWLRMPLENGETLALWHDMARSVESIRRYSARDAEAWPRFCERMAALAGLLARIYVAPPPSLIDLRFAMRVRRLGRQAMEELMRLLPMPVAELLDDWFESDALKGGLGALAVRDLHQGPRSAGTAFCLLHRHVGNPLGVFRAPQSNLGAVLAARAGVAFRGGRAARIGVREGKVTSVGLDDGAELPASLVVSEADPPRTLDELVEPGWLDPDLLRAVRHIRSRAVAVTLLFELERAPAWKSLTIAPSLDYVERAYDAVKYRCASAAPWADVRIDGKSAEVHVQYVPEGKADGLADFLAAHLAIARRREQRPNLPHAELTLDQALWMRPLPELARYATPIEGLWLCGPAMHPGIAGICGYNCANAALSAR